MSQRSQQEQNESLQHAAEHERPTRRNPVLFYLMILFAAAFLLLLLSFFMQHRANQEAMDNLQETSNSAVQSLEHKLKENDQLKEEVARLEEENQRLTQQLEAGAAQSAAEREELEDILQALSALNTLRSLYNQGRYSDARDFLAEQEVDADGVYAVEHALRSYTQGYADQSGLEVYDPLKAWQQLTDWLG